jgi:hypothetical protein
VAVAVLSTLVLLLPVIIYLLLRGGSEQTPAPGEAAPSASSPAPSHSSAPASRAPDGHISLETLRNSTVTIPPWPSDNVRGPSGRLHFKDGVVRIPQTEPAGVRVPPLGSEIVLLGAAYGDVDRDGSDETIAEYACLVEGGSKQLVALDRDTSGRIVTLGQVVATTGEIRDLRDDSVRVADGAVTARVGDFQRCCDDQTPQVWQERAYRRVNGRFEQVSGPTRMPANPDVTETSVTAGELVLGPVLDGYRYGTVTVTVRNGWGTRPAHVLLGFSTGGALERAGTAWPPATTPPTASDIVMAVAPPPAGRGVRYTFAFRRPTSWTGIPCGSRHAVTRR